MADIHDVDWFLERVEPARWSDEARGRRDLHAACPVCGGSDPLHITEKNGKALVQCFSCSADYRAVVEALEDGAEDTEGDESEASVVVNVSSHGLRKKAGKAAAPTTGPGIADPLGWLADYCQVDRAWMEREIPVRATPDGWLAYWWPTAAVTKDRQPGGEGRRWTPKGVKGGPRMWPSPPNPVEAEVWLLEGETDVIAMRGRMGVAPAYTFGSATTLPTVTELEALRDLGCESVVVAYDNDRDGHEARRKVVAAAKEAGLMVSVASPGHPLYGGPKDWRQRVEEGDDTTPLADSDREAQEVWRMDDIAAQTGQGLWLDRVHPADHTILFGDGGTGKGVIAAWWVAQLTRKPHQKRVLVLDYEAHAGHEWRPRLDAFGGDLKRVFLVQPTHAIWDEVAAIRQMIGLHLIDLVVVDSVTYACLGMEVEKSATAAQYSVAIGHLGVPVLSLAHVTKSDADPNHPFGSVFWSNGARITWAVSYDYNDPASPRLLRAAKANQGAPSPPVEIDWGWVTTTLPKTLTESVPKTKRGDQKLAILQVLENGPRTAKQLEADLGLSKAMVSRYGTELEARGMITRASYGQPWTLATIVSGDRFKAKE